MADRRFSTLLLNLPNRQVITRRYMCSYNSPMSLFPPYELISLGGIIRSWKQQPVALLDAVAEACDRRTVLARVGELAPDLIVTMAGFECFGDDMAEIDAIKDAYPDVPIALMGHYPTLFPAEVLQNTKVDYILLGEPDAAFSELFDALVGGDISARVAGVVSRRDAAVPVNGGVQRLKRIEQLPLPAFELLDPNRYGEPAMPRPFGMVQSVRGCPYGCNYCVRSYGRQMVEKDIDQTLNEIRFLVDRHRIRSLRFIDDTFTARRERTIEICRRLIEERIAVRWACLTRTDAIDEELLQWMRAAGCQRIYFGIESGSQRMLDLYRKGTQRDQALDALLLCRRIGIETSAFFLMGLPFETDADFAATVEFARRAKLTYAMIAPLILYPGTDLFDAHRDEIQFSLFPYENYYRDPTIAGRVARWEREFYRRFYLSPSFVARNLTAAAQSPWTMIKYAGEALRYVVLPPGKAANPFTNLDSPAPGRSDGRGKPLPLDRT